MGRMGICFTSVATSWWGEAYAACYYASRRGLVYCVALSANLNFDYLGECSHWGSHGRGVSPTYGENLRYITPGTSLVNEAPPMLLRASSHPGSPNSPKLSMAQLPWHTTQHQINITRLFIYNWVWQDQFYSAPLPPEGHETHDATHTGPGTPSVRLAPHFH